MSFALTYDQIHDFNGNVGRISFWARIEAFFSFAWLESWMVRTASKPVQEIHDLVFGVYQQILAGENVLDGVTTREYEEFSEFVRKLTKLKSIYAKANYFDSGDFERLLDTTLQITYAVEAEIRVKAFEHKKRQKTDDDLKAALAETSKRSILSKLEG